MLLICALVFTFTGCRKSSVIEKIIYDQKANEIDYESGFFIAKNDLKNSKIDPDLPSKKTEKSKKKEKKQKEANKKGTQNNPGKTAKTKLDPNADKKGAKKEIPKKDDIDNEKKGEKNDGKGNKGGGESEDINSRQIYDNSGNTIDVPEHVNKVVAPASAAGIVQMLGGKNILVGSSSDFLGSSLVQEVFSDEGISSASTLWNGDGSDVMSDSNFQKLLSLKPDVCIGVSGESNFSNSQISKMKEKKIAYISLPNMNTHKNILDAVEIMGSVISDRTAKGGVNGKKLAASYEDFSENLIKEMTDKSGGRFTWDNIDYNNDVDVNGIKKYSGSISKKGKYTLYISDWESNATYAMSHGGDLMFQETGLAVSPQGYSYSPLSYYMSASGTCNNAARFTNRNKSTYPVIPVNVNTATNKISGSSLSLYEDLNECFTRVYNGSSSDVALGESDFKKIVVENSDIKSKIQSSNKLWKNHGQTKVGNRTDYGFVGDNGELVTSYIRGDYDILVNPHGVSSWVEGSQESFLETVWVSSKITGVSSDSDVKREVRDFYKTFYRHDLTDSQLNRILGGK